MQREVDPGYAEVLIRKPEAKEKEAVVTLGVKWKVEETESAKPLDEKKTAQYRALAARADYLGLDRVCVAYAAKERDRHMTQPRSIDWLALR